MKSLTSLAVIINWRNGNVGAVTKDSINKKKTNAKLCNTKRATKAPRRRHTDGKLAYEIVQLNRLHDRMEQNSLFVTERQTTQPIVLCTCVTY